MDHMHYSAKRRVGLGCLTHTPLLISPSCSSLITNLMLTTVPPQEKERQQRRRREGRGGKGGDEVIND